MTDFPAHTLVNVPDHVFLKGRCQVIVRIDKTSPIKKITTHYKKRLHCFQASHEILKHTASLESLADYKIRITLKASGLAAITDHEELLRQTRPVFLVPLDKNTIKCINFATGLNFPVHIVAETSSDKNRVLKKVLEFYLHNPLLTVPIEPLHTLIQTTARGAGFNLWDTELENWKSDFFVSDRLRVSLSGRWLDQKKSYGDTTDTWKKITASKLYQHHANYKQNLFKQKSPCVFCPHLAPCGAYLRALKPDKPCEHWKETFKKLEAEGLKAKKLIKKYEAQETL
ncbi:MAG: hypothetical protein HQM16_15540 [Deltaproteobacteria bacterium]|nr:hypothetical protein [Deltaproteobacteria bacterium]